MDLFEMRELFREKTGRRDMTDLRVDMFLNSGQRFLEKRIEVAHSLARYVTQVPAGVFKISVPDCRVAYNVWAANTDGRVKLRVVSISDARQIYSKWSEVAGGEIPTLTNYSSQQGTPTYYAVDTFVGIPPTQIPFLQGSLEFSAQNLKVQYDGAERILTTSYNLMPIILLPAPDTDMTITVEGKFWMPKLLNNSDRNYFTEVHPLLLLYAAAYKLEVSYRNTEGAKDWLFAIAEELIGMDHDQAELISAGIVKQEG